MAQTVPLLFLEQAKANPDIVAQYVKDGSGEFQPISYAELAEGVKRFAAGLLELGLERGDRVGLISDNRREWMVSDLAILGLGAADVPRGCDATEGEIAYILGFSECRLALLENEKQLRKIIARKAEMPLLRTAVLFDPPADGAKREAEAAGVAIRSFAEVDGLGVKRAGRNPGEYEAEAAKGRRDDRATLIFTSGTTGEPKGVSLSHGNFLHQIEQIPRLLMIKPRDIWLSVLPVWHSFERILQYVPMASASSIAYSKPVGSVMLADMQAVRPQWLASVPRIWESVKDGVYRSIKSQGGAKAALFGFFVGVGESFAFFRNHLLGRMPDFDHRSRALEVAASLLPFLLLAPLYELGNLLVFKKIKAKLGGRFVAGISGGGALPPAVDRFFDALGILVLEGYGLTETAPVIGVRLQRRPVVGTIGPVLQGTELAVVDDKGQVLPHGRKGRILVRGPQVMQGYYRRPELTAKVLSPDGWLDTGDLGALTRRGELRITGRAKDTIVLRGGENVEPAPIEQKLCESEYIKQAVVLGQDQKYLAALVVPDQDAVTAWAKENNVPIVDYEDLLRQPEVEELIDYEVNELVSAKNGFKSFERIFRFAMLGRAFEVDRELSAKQEIKRFAINELYKREIARLFAG
ncbi:MAG TPA: long-chain fatty acid--CoA ligase [Spirochaetales bacterium]|nr:long-chain fatty acid--CoA ligase [Spirochaetales bacterium]HRY53676.1 long-chain fatty acid--CoA ligase [Spirochaetia bacterium]HRZ64266.1 long-chain fatty acid--CoA ligase [Spirochaetia bacterium]